MKHSVQIIELTLIKINNDTKVSIDYAQYSRYEKLVYNYNDFINKNFGLKNSTNKNENPNLNNDQQNFKLRSKIWDLSNNHQKKSISNNFQWNIYLLEASIIFH